MTFLIDSFFWKFPIGSHSVFFLLFNPFRHHFLYIHLRILKPEINNTNNNHYYYLLSISLLLYISVTIFPPIAILHHSIHTTPQSLPLLIHTDERTSARNVNFQPLFASNACRRWLNRTAWRTKRTSARREAKSLHYWIDFLHWTQLIEPNFCDSLPTPTH